MRLLTFSAAAALLMACTTLQSSSLRTSGMSADIVVSADGTGASHVTTQLHVDTNATDYVDLTSGDSLVANAGGKTVNMSRDNVLGIVTYTADFTGADQAGTVYTVSLNRTSDTSAPSSTVTMPKAIAITAPTSAASFSRTQADITVTYDTAPGTDIVSYQVSGDCLDGYSGNVPGDPGTFTIPKTTLTAPANKAQSTCAATVTVTRRSTGTVDSHFGSGGYVWAKQVRSAGFTTTP